METFITIMSILTYIIGWIATARVCLTKVVLLPGDKIDTGDVIISLFLALLWPVAVAVSPIVGLGVGAGYLITTPERKENKRKQIEIQKAREERALQQNTERLERSIYRKTTQ